MRRTHSPGFDGPPRRPVVCRHGVGSRRAESAADAGSRRSVNRLFLIRDILTSQYVYLSAMAEYLDHGGRSRGSVLYTDEGGSLPLAGEDGPELELEETDLKLRALLSVLDGDPD